MVNPINTDKSISAGTDTTTASNRRVNLDAAGSQSPKFASQTGRDTESLPDVENARELYQLENSQLETVRPEIETAEQARTLLNQILQQFSATPEDALKTQGGGSNSLLTKLLSAAPA